MSAPQELIDAIRRSTSVFVKTENYVPAHLHRKEGDTTLADTWEVERLRQYLAGECDLNYGSTNKDFQLGRRSISIFVGDTHHSWIHHYHVRVGVGADQYEWQRVL